MSLTESRHKDKKRDDSFALETARHTVPNCTSKRTEWS